MNFFGPCFLMFMIFIISCNMKEFLTHDGIKIKANIAV
jgi:hypothetical protein